MAVALSLASFKAFLRDPQTYHYINDFHDTRIERTTADRFWHLCTEAGETIPGNPRFRTFRRRFERAKIEHKLGIYATLQEARIGSQLSTTEHYPLLQRHYKPDQVSDNKFLKALIALGPDNINILVTEALGKDAMSERKGRIKRLRRMYNQHHQLEGKDRVSKDDVDLMLEHYMDVMHIPYTQTLDTVLNMKKRDLDTLLISMASAQQARRTVAQALAQAPPIPSMRHLASQQTAIASLPQHTVQQNAPPLQPASAPTATQRPTPSTHRQSPRPQTPRNPAIITARNRRNRKKALRKAAVRKREAENQDTTALTSHRPSDRESANPPLPDSSTTEPSGSASHVPPTTSRYRSPSPELGSSSLPAASQSNSGRKRKRSTTPADQLDEAADDAPSGSATQQTASALTVAVPESSTAPPNGPTTSAEGVAPAAESSLDEDEQIALWLQQQPSPQTSSRPTTAQGFPGTAAELPEASILTPEQEHYAIDDSPGHGQYHPHSFGVDHPERALLIAAGAGKDTDAEEDNDMKDDEDLDMMADDEAEEDAELEEEEDPRVEHDEEDEQFMTHTQALAAEDEDRVSDSNGGSTPRATQLQEVSPELGSSQPWTSSQTPAVGEASQRLQNSLGLDSSQERASSQAPAAEARPSPRFVGKESPNIPPYRSSFLSWPTQAFEGHSTISYPNLPDAEGLGSPMASESSLDGDEREARDISDIPISLLSNSQQPSQSQLPLSLREISRRNSIRIDREDSEDQLPKQDVEGNEDAVITASQAEEFSTIVDLITPDASSQQVGPSRAAAPSPSPSIALSKHIEKERAETAASPIQPVFAREGTPSCSVPPASSGARTFNCVSITSPEVTKKPTARRALRSQIPPGSPPPREQVFRPLATSPYRFGNNRVSALRGTSSSSSRRDAAASPRPSTPQTLSATAAPPTYATPSRPGISSALSSPRSVRSFATAFEADPHTDDEEGSTPRPSRATFLWDSRVHSQSQQQPLATQASKQQTSTPAPISSPASNLRSRHPQPKPQESARSPPRLAPSANTTGQDTGGAIEQDFHDPMIRYA